MLNEQQKEAVSHTKGPLLVLAGAGTGKTKVLTSRIIKIINTNLAAPNQILAVTFTNKAAFEMRQRIISEIGDDANNIWSGTFHSIASKILKRHPEVVGIKSDFTIIDSDDQLRLIKQILADLEIDTKSYPPKGYLYQIERFKDKAIRAQTLSKDSYNSHALPSITKVYLNYQNKLKSLNVVDFGDLLLYNLEIFKQSAETLQYYQNKFHYILVDEYQDTNATQYQWLINLAGKEQNICAVGDDDQSIYSWRGAEISNILKFEKDFKNTKIIRLEQNYRSTSNILRCATHLIKNNSQRHDKTLWSESENGEKIKLWTFVDDRSEASQIAHIIDALQSKIKLTDIAILVRAGYQTRSFEEAFIANSLPYRIIGGLRFFERREIKDIIAYLRVIYNEDDDLALQRIINLPKRGVGNATIKKLLVEASNANSSLFTGIKRAIELKIIKGKVKENLENFIKKIIEWREFSSQNKLEELVKNILNESGYLAMWKNEITPDATSRVENLKEFTSSVEKFQNLGEFLEHVSLVSNNESDNSLQKDMINIMTVHGAKGLEFDTIFIPGLEEGVFPSSRSIEERDGLEEERRLFYVAITRAKRELNLSYTQNRMVFGSFQPGISSRFLRELPQDVLDVRTMDSPYADNNRNNQREYQEPSANSWIRSTKLSGGSSSVIKTVQNKLINKRVFHQKFGYGKVMKVNEEKLQISFEKSGEKTVMKNFIELA
jgi:DNA helicase-2/ATP-dependent DNA helicase PcrA